MHEPREPAGEPPTELLGHGGQELAPRVGQWVGRYLVLGELGRGGMAVVYAAYDPELDRKVALKLLGPKLAEEGDTAAAERLLREAQALARLSHPNVVQVHDAGTAFGQVFLTMELVSGSTLGAWLENGNRPWQAVREHFLAAGRGLAAAHAAGLVHRDFKLANVLLGDDGRVRVSDFGLARPVGEALPAPVAGLEDRLGGSRESPGGRTTEPLTQPGSVVGTPLYLAPEVLFGAPADAQSDQFAFGVALYRALHGVFPFAGKRLLDHAYAAREGRFSPLPAGAPAVPAWLDQVVRRALAGDPASRFPSMDALLEALDRDPAVRRRRLLGTATLVLVGALAGALALGLTSRARARCAGGEEALAGVWDNAARARLAAVFAASPAAYASAAAASVEHTLDDYSRLWVAARRDACEATAVRGEQSEELYQRRLRCFDRRLDDLRALVTTLEAGEIVIDKAAAAVRELPTLERCSGLAVVAGRLPTAADAPRVRALETRLAEARAQLIAGRYATGRTLAEAAVTESQALGDRALESEARWLAARLAQGAGDYAASEDQYFAAAAAAAAIGDDRRAAEVWSGLAFLVGGRNSRFAEAHRWERLAQAAITRFGGDPASEAELAVTRSWVARSEGDAEGARAAAAEAVAIYERERPADDPALGRALNMLGSALLELGRLEEARATYERALEQAQRLLGPDHPTVAIRLGNLALALDDLGDFEQSFVVQQRAFDIELRAFGPDHPQLALTHGNLGFSLTTLGRYEEALAQHERALAIQLETLGPDHVDVAVSRINRAFELGHVGRTREALAEARRALVEVERSVGPDHEWTIAARACVGGRLVDVGRHTEAIPLLERTLRERADKSPELRAQTSFELAQALWVTGRDRPRALALAHEARAAFDGPSSPHRKRQKAAVERWLAARGG
ncbi:MAG: serine/threonine-protein kinase [Thermoanaerobaculia bacterium]|nr:serine/threonine-protein kinase [Thermoanaerobaculia bacterium]